MPLLEKDLNKIVQGDCVKRMQALPKGSVDLVFADPPFNIGYEYDVYRDKKDRQAYLDWSKSWISAVYDVLKESGTFWLAIGDEYAAELKLASQEIGFHPRSWVIWYYTFGVNCKQKFSRSHAHLFYFVKDPQNYTFRCDEPENRIPSARQLVYADNRANPVGRLPDDTWVLRPQDLADCFTTAEDTWYFPRVAGTFKERAGFHGCQMPEQLLGRIIRYCSEPGQVVLDPFSGSATTVAVAKKLGRNYLAFDLSKDYVERGRTRLEGICIGDPLDGAAEPTVSAPSTVAGKTRKGIAKPPTVKPRASDTAHQEPGLSPAQLKLIHDGLLEAYRRTYDGYSLDRVVADPDMSSKLRDTCERIGLPGDARTWNWHLFGLRKSGRLIELPVVRRTKIDWSDCEPYLFASEIAWRQMVDSGIDSLDTILCDPALAAEFDGYAKLWAPGFSSLQYRWAALKLRKSAWTIRNQAKVLTDTRLSKPVELTSSSKGFNWPSTAGVFVVFGSKDEPIYAGEATNLNERIDKTKGFWQGIAKSPIVRFSSVSSVSNIDGKIRTLLAYQKRLVHRHRPQLNFLDQKIA